MATIKHVLARTSDQFDPIGSAFPRSVRLSGTNFPVEGLAFADGADQACVTRLKATNYGSGNITAILTWCADTATSGVVRWGASLACITPESDSQDVTTDSFATEVTVDDTHLGTTARRKMNATITINQLDSIAADDIIYLRIRRIGTNVNDTMTDSAILMCVELQYSDT